MFVAVAFALGIAGEGLSHEHTSALVYFVPALIGTSAACLLVGAVLVRARREVVAAFVVLAGFVFAGAASAALFNDRFPPTHLSNLESWGIDLSRPLDLEGTVLSDPIRSPSGVEFDLEATKLSQVRDGLAESRVVIGKVRATAAYTTAADSAGALGLQGGDRIRASMRLRQPRVYRNPGSFDFRKRAESIEDLYWEGSIDDARQLRKLSSEHEVGATRVIGRVRGHLRAAIDRLYPPWSADGRDGAVLKAILLGDRSALDSATIDHFRTSGLYHLLVIAGLHVGLIAALILALCRLLRLRRNARNLCLLAMLLAYAFVVEQRAPTLRATLMVVIFVLAELLGRDHTALNAVGVAALILLVTRPARLFESGFQLSFAAALLIVGLAAPLLRATIEPYRSSLRELSNIERDTALLPRQAQFRLDLRLLISTARQNSRLLDAHPEATQRLVTWPLYAGFWLAEVVLFSALLQIGLLLPMVQEFHRVALAGVGLNALALPVTAVLLAVSIPTVILAVFLPAWAAWPAKGVAAVLRLLFALASLPHLPAWLSYRVPSPPAWVAAGFAVSLIVVALTLRRNQQGLAASSLSFAVFAILLVTAPFSPRLPAAALELTALDCGRGEAIFLVLPNRSTVLLGAGGAGRAGPPAFARAQRWDAGENIVSPYLWSRGVKRISIVVIASAGGNLQGFVALLQNFHVDEVWYARNLAAEDSGGELQAIFSAARQRGTQLREVATGEILRLGTTEFRMQPAVAGAWNRGEPAGQPFVMQVTNPRGSATVAIGMSPESVQRAETSTAIPSMVLTTDRTGLAWAARSGLLQSVSPRLVIVAPGSRSGLMSTGSVVDAAPRKAGVHTLETDVEGAITVEMMPSTFEVRTFRGSEGKLP
ncbi:MAG TPA: ComEC/Rec2 family competence protein [Terriglobia bacterium]|nr:ComEC/Rec2 family competence protein [Terriglobia bacterium]